MKFFVTGSSGFIGSAVCQKLLKSQYEVIGLDNHNDYYDPNLKKARLDILNKYSNFHNYLGDLEDDILIKEIFSKHKPRYIINLAAQAGVRYSLENPKKYVQSNIDGFLNLLEICRYNEIDHLVFASSSSVYGMNKNVPFSTKDTTNHPLSFYAVTKKTNELMSHSYSSLFQIPISGIRFFTVYGPWGRPDMALFKFTEAIINNNPIEVFNNGDHKRDFTYIDDAIECLMRVILNPPCISKTQNKLNHDNDNSEAPWKIYNIGNNNPTKLIDFINLIEKEIGKKAIIKFLPMQVGDVKETYADMNSFANTFGYIPKTDIKVGVKKFVNWYKEYFL